MFDIFTSLLRRKSFATVRLPVPYSNDNRVEKSSEGKRSDMMINNVQKDDVGMQQKIDVPCEKLEKTTKERVADPYQIIESQRIRLDDKDKLIERLKEQNAGLIKRKKTKSFSPELIQPSEKDISDQFMEIEVQNYPNTFELIDQIKANCNQETIKIICASLSSNAKKSTPNNHSQVNKMIRDARKATNSKTKSGRSKKNRRK